MSEKTALEDRLIRIAALEAEINNLQQFFDLAYFRVNGPGRSLELHEAVAAVKCEPCSIDVHFNTLPETPAEVRVSFHIDSFHRFVNNLSPSQAVRILQIVMEKK